MVLELILEAVLCPIVYIAVVEVEFAGEDYVDMLQERQIRRRPDAVCLVRNDRSTIIAFPEGAVDDTGVVASGRGP